MSHYDMRQHQAAKRVTCFSRAAHACKVAVRFALDCLDILARIGTGAGLRFAAPVKQFMAAIGR